jgi:pyrrolidone-carboxylate peptidase
MHRLSTEPFGAVGGFIHVPATSDHRQVGLPLDLMVQGIGVAIETALTVKSDLREPSGAVA